MQIEPKIFKAYDIRGVYPNEINEGAVYNIARAVAVHFKTKRVVIGKDIRSSSDSLEEKLVEGFIDSGVDVIKIGMATTPMVYRASSQFDVDAAIIITASHNPAQYNGMKICLKNAVPVGKGAGMEEIKELASAGNFETSGKKGEITIEEGFSEKYINFIKSFYNTEKAKKRKIVIDFANAMGIMYKKIYEDFSDSLETVYLFDEMDGTFPNHEANPLKTETLADLQKKVVEEKADLGIAFDGDADRVGFVDENGEVIPMDFMTALLGSEVLKKHPGGLILVDLRSSNSVKEYIEEAGGKTNLSRVGHSLIKKQMRDEGAVFAGELSGHYYFQENSNAEVSALATIFVLNLMNETGKSISELTKDLKRYHHSGEINSEVKNTKAVLDKIREKYQGGKMIEIDGIRIDFDDWWFNVRSSNTESLVRLTMEAKTKEMMEEKRDELLALIRE